MAFETHPLTLDRWDDFVGLFGPRGACAGCWCMYPRQTQAEFDTGKGAPNRRAMRRLVQREANPGLLGYVDGEAVAWCALGPREEYGRLARSRVLKPVDEQPVWSIVCLFVRKDQRGSGMSKRMLREAARYAAQQGGRILEGYPTEPRTDKMPDAFAWTGIASAFRAAGFVECARRSPTRPIMRRKLRPVRKR